MLGMSGLELLPKARAARPDVPIIMITAYGDAETKRLSARLFPKICTRAPARLSAPIRHA